MSLATVGLCLAAEILIGANWRRIRGTTLVWPACWAMFSLAALAAAQVALALDAAPSAMHSYIRYVAAATTFCPLMALLGGKRPQDRAWQLIVLSLWVVAALPALVEMAYRPSSLQLHAAWRWLLLLPLVLMGLLNYLPTRFWPSAVLAACGQVGLLGEQLPLPGREAASWAPAHVVATVAMGLFLLAILLVALGIPRRDPGKTSIDRLWLDFRDNFGAVWALRVAERFNASAAMYNWRVQLTWSGLRAADATEPAHEDGHAREDDASEETAAAMQASLRSLLRRFVSPEWIARRTLTCKPPDIQDA